MPMALVEKGKDLLYRYLSREQFKRMAGFYHPDPLIDEFSYGEGGGFSALIWNNVNAGSRIFFHTTIGGTRYLTAMYIVTDLAPAAVWRANQSMKKKYRNPHLHPEENPGWWGDDTEHREFEKQVRDAYIDGGIITNTDVVIIGHPRESLDIRKAPLILNKSVLARLDMGGKAIKWDIVDKHGRIYDESRCISTCLRAPRVLSKADGDLLEGLVRKAAKEKSRESFSHIRAIDPFLSSTLELQCATEDEIEKCLIGKLDAIEPGLKFIANQVRLKSGNRIDVLAERPDGTPVIIEIKKGTADDRTLAQLVSYLHEFPADKAKRDPIGKIICADASVRLRSACEHLQIEVHCYGDVFSRRE